MATSAYAAKPSSLKGGPVPGSSEQDEVNSFMSNFNPPDVVAPADTLDVAEAPPVEDVPPPSAPVTPSNEQFAPEPGFIQANMEQFQNFTTRLQAGLAANDNEKLGLLQKKFGPDNATVKDGNIYFRRDTKEKFKKLDPATLEVVNDLIPDFAREIVTEAAMLPGEAAGAAAAGPAGAVVGRVASVPLADQFANKVASAVGVPQDESRNQMIESGIGMAAEAVLPFAGRQIVKRLPGTLAYRAAREAGERETVALSKQSQEVAKAVQDLAADSRVARIDGASVGIPEANVSLMGHHLNPDSPKLQQLAHAAASDPRFINAQTQLAEDWGSLLNNTMTEIGRRNNPGPYKPEALAATVTNAVSDIQKAEGKAIGVYKNKAMMNLKNKPQKLGPESAQLTQSLVKELGFKIVPTESGIKIKPPQDIQALVGKMGLTSVGEVRAVVNNVNDVAKSLQDGVTVSELERLRNSVGAVSDSLSRTQAGALMGQLSGALRKDYRGIIQNGLPDEIEKRGFNTAMDDFSTLMDNVKVLKGALNEDASAKAIVNSFFTGKENLQKVRAIKQISPESYGSLKEEFVNKLLTDYGSRQSPTGFKSGAFLDAVDKKYGREFLSEVLNDGPGPNLDTVRKILTVNERIERQFKNASVDALSEAQKKGAMNAVIGLLADMKWKTVNGLSSVFSPRNGKDNILTQIMTRDGIDKYVAAYPGKIDKKGVMQNLNDILAQSRVFRAIDERVEKGIVPRATRRILIDDKIKPKQEFNREAE